jgi:Ca2+/H+ antiporter
MQKYLNELYNFNSACSFCINGSIQSNVVLPNTSCISTKSLAIPVLTIIAVGSNKRRGSSERNTG